MASSPSREKQLRYMEYYHRENGIRHHSIDEDEYQYELIKAGNPKAGEETRKILEAGLTGHISEDPLRNAKYLFVACAALASRAAMSAGVASERANTISDYYILKMDVLTSIDAIRDLQVNMMEFFAKEVAETEKQPVISRDISKAMDFIYENLHEPLTVEGVADHLGISRSYFSTLFHEETGETCSEYIARKRIEAARNMLRYSDFSQSLIASTLAFSSQSHFIRVFRKYTGMTPNEYKKRYAEG